MTNKKMPVGIDNFRELIEENYYFVDKTPLISNMLLNSGAKVTLFTRPRRFGKTLCMSMMSEFFDIRKDSKELFKNLEIGKNSKLCSEYMNQYPTVFITLKDIVSTSFPVAYDNLKKEISKLFKSNSYILDEDFLDDDDREIFLKLKSESGSVSDTCSSLSFLINILRRYYNKPVILLIDEYDVPVAKAEQNSYYREMMDVIRGLLSQVLKGNDALKFAVITGCLKITKESIFTGLNNLATDTIVDVRYDEYFGFTEEEIKKLLSDCALENHFANIKEWYDGYKFGNADIYCPWDVINYVSDLMINENIKPKAYWNNTSDNAIVKELIKHCKGDVVKKIETLISDGCITEAISPYLTYDLLYLSEQNLWSVLYLTGYLTKVDTDDSTGEFRITLKIPNKEVSFIFKNTVLEWFKSSVRNWNREAMFSAIWNKKDDIATTEITKLLRKTISYHDYGEDFYHAFLAGIFTGAGYAVESNREHGDGRSDIAVSDIENGRIAIFEVKYSKAKANLQSDCEKAISQIDSRRYAEEYSDEYDEVFCYGISFYKKQCKVLIKE